MRTVSGTTLYWNTSPTPVPGHCLSFILPKVNKLSVLFQKSTENTSYELDKEMSWLACLFAAYVLSIEAILEVADDLSKLSQYGVHQLPDKELGIGVLQVI